MEDLIPVPIDEDPNKVMKIGSNLCEKDRQHLISLLHINVDVFAWSTSNIPSIDPEVIVYQLNVDPKHCSVKQKKRSFALEQQKVKQEEVDKLLKMKFVQEVYYPEWLANIVLIKKANKKWRACIDYIDLNKACPKDSYPLSRIDQLMDATSGHQL